MPQRCTTCDHPDRAAIDRALVTRPVDYAGLVAHYGVTKSSLRRHADAHLSAELVKTARAREEVAADRILERLLGLHSETLRILREARAGGKPQTALLAIARAEKQLELQARLVGQLRDGPQVQVNILLSPEWQRLQSAILAALEPFPEARVSVARALAVGGV